MARGVNSLGEGELRTAAEVCLLLCLNYTSNYTYLLYKKKLTLSSLLKVKRRYLDWRALMKRKQLQAELSFASSSSSSLALKTEYDQSSPEHEASSLGAGCDQLLDLSGFPKDYHCDWPELAALSELSGQATMAPPGVKMEDDISEYRVRNRKSSSTPRCHITIRFILTQQFHSID